MDGVAGAEGGRRNRRIGDSIENRRLEAERARLATAMAQSGESIVITDPSGAIAYVNAAFERLTGYTRAEAIGQNPRILKSGVQDAAFYEAMWAILVRGETWRGSLVNRARDGRLFEEEATISPVFDSSGTLISYVAVKRDVTREREAERALRQSEEQLRAIFDSVGDGVAISEPWGRFLEVNRLLCDRLGYTRDELLTMPVSAINSAESAATIPGRVEAMMAGRSVPAIDATHVRSDGSEIPIEAVSRRIEFRGQPAILSVYRDVTERQRAQEALREQARSTQELLDALAFPIVAHYRDGRPQLANTAYLAGPGRPLDGIPGKTYGGLSEAEVEMHAAHGRPVREEGAVETYEADLHFPDGTTRRQLLTKAPLRSRDGEITGLVTAGVDISDRYQAEQSLRQSEERFRTLFENAGQALLIIDETGHFLDANRRAYQPLGYTRDEFLAMSVRDIDTPRTSAGFAERVSRLLEQGTISFESEHVARDGTVIPTEITATTIVIEGKPAVLTIVRDLTERRRAEAERTALELQLRQSQKMEAIGRLAGGVAHDFNNLLTAIGGYARILEADLETGTADPADAAEIRHAADRAAALTARLLTFAGRHHAQPVPIDLAASVGQILPMLRRIVPERIEIEAELRPGAPIQADPTELDQVIINLVVNAADAIPAIGQIAIRTGTVDHYAASVAGKVNSRPGPHARITVADTGVGMDATVRAHMFEPFFTTKGGGGTGLGLATVYGIVERMGGTIEVSSTPGHGTVFEIDLPASGPADELAAETIEPAAAGGTERILIVEDEATVRSFASTALVRLGYRVIAAAGPADAERIPESDYDMIITDVVMPGMDGTELARKLRLTRPDLPVLFVSGYIRGSVAADMLDQPRTGMLAKPYTLAELANAARKLLDEGAGT